MEQSQPRRGGDHRFRMIEPFRAVPRAQLARIYFRRRIRKRDDAIADGSLARAPSRAARLARLIWSRRR